MRRAVVNRIATMKILSGLCASLCTHASPPGPHTTGLPWGPSEGRRLHHRIILFCCLGTAVRLCRKICLGMQSWPHAFVCRRSSRGTDVGRDHTMTRRLLTGCSPLAPRMHPGAFRSRPTVVQQLPDSCSSARCWAIGPQRYWVKAQASAAVAVRRLLAVPDVLFAPRDASDSGLRRLRSESRPRTTCARRSTSDPKSVDLAGVQTRAALS